MPSAISLPIQVKMPALTAAKYGKDNIRVCKVDRDPTTGIQNVTEMTVTVLLEGEIDVS
jgi:urate oxidase